MGPIIPSEVENFIALHIKSLDQLEVLLLLAALPDREWSVDAVYQVVKSSRQAVSQRLDEFVTKGLIARGEAPDTYRYCPQTDETANAISQLGAVYKTSRHKILELIYSSKNDAVKGFSEAFRFRKSK